MELEQISHTLESLPVNEALETLLSGADPDKACLTCSFQAEDMIVLHLLRQQIPNVPVLFLDTGYHFAQTYEYRDRIAREWELRLVNVLPQQTVSQQESQFGVLYKSNPTQCCQLRKVEPLMQSL